MPTVSRTAFFLQNMRRGRNYSRAGIRRLDPNIFFFVSVEIKKVNIDSVFYRFDVPSGKKSLTVLPRGARQILCVCML